MVTCAFFESVTENWRYFRFSPHLDSVVKLAVIKYLIKEEGAGRGEMFICSKLRQNLLEMEDRTL